MNTRTINSINPRLTQLVTGAMLVFSAAAIAAPPGSGVTPPAPDETEVNDTWSQRDVLTGSDGCRWERTYLGHLGEYDPNQPDTAVCVTTFELGCDASNDDGNGFGGTNQWARFGGSAALFIEPALGFPGDWAPIPRIAVSGKGSYIGTSPVAAMHNQVGRFEMYVEFYNSSGNFISREVYEGELTGGDSEVFFHNIPVPPTTRDFDVIVNPLAEEFGDVDFYEIEGLRPLSDYVVTVRGLNHRNPGWAQLDTILTQWSLAAAVPAFQNDDICNTPGCYNPGSRLVCRTNSQGRLIVSVTGWDDFDNDGLSDSQGYRHRATGGYYLHVRYTCNLGCADIDGNCTVDFSDLNELLDRWGETCDQ